MKYLVTKKFISGNLKGIEITQETNVKFKVGHVVEKPCGGTSGYIVIAVKER